MISHEALALSGVAQAAGLVNDIAHGRAVDDVARRATLAAVMTHRAQHLAEVFPVPEAFRPGMQSLNTALSGTAIKPEIVRYSLQLMDLAARLRRDNRTADRLGQLLDDLGTDDVAVTEPGIDRGTEDLAEVYRQTIAKLGKRIQVTGDPDLLRQESIANSIRAQLLAGIRFAWLWQQLGGRRWHLILRRRSLLIALQSLMSRD